jgi:predicted nuclease of restriction endonuclease-like (RecB) superfamily
MIQFAQVFADEEMVATLSRHLGWSHFVEIIPLKDELQRQFYAEMCRVERWSVRQLRQKISGMLFAFVARPKRIRKREGVSVAFFYSALRSYISLLGKFLIAGLKAGLTVLIPGRHHWLPAPSVLDP